MALSGAAGTPAPYPARAGRPPARTPPVTGLRSAADLEPGSGGRAPPVVEAARAASVTDVGGRGRGTRVPGSTGPASGSGSSAGSSTGSEGSTAMSASSS
ncbi:MAG: hypothetical protein ACKOZU_05570, partial [Planctomycetaceae bacterium]